MMRRVRVGLVFLLCCTLAACAGARANPRQQGTASPDSGALAQERSPVAIGVWTGLWNGEHRNLELYQRLRGKVPPGEAQSMVDTLIQGQQTQIRLIEEMFESVREPGGGVLTRLPYPPIPPELSARELAWEALDLEERLMGDYNTFPSEFAGTALQDEAETLVRVQTDQLQTLQALAGSRPKVQERLHRVKEGETLARIAAQYGVSILDLVEANPALKEGLRPEQVLRVVKPICP